MQDLYKSTKHRDRTITFWDVYRQQWQRISVDTLANSDLLITLCALDRKWIEKKAKKYIQPII